MKLYFAIIIVVAILLIWANEKHPGYVWLSDQAPPVCDTGVVVGTEQ